MNRPVFFDHDGGIDDYLSLLLLLGYEDLDILGISVTPADCFAEAAVPATRRILDLAGRTDIVTAEATIDGPNPFPDDWRLDSFKIEAFPIFNQSGTITSPLSEETGQGFLARSILDSPEPVTLLMTGPLTNLAWALNREPAIESNISELVWMGGALDVPGNVTETGHDGSAEWNVYWDPPAAKRVWDSELDITVFPLDATNIVPVTDAFLRRVGLQYDYMHSRAAGNMWALTAAHEMRTGEDYYFWDTLTTSYLAVPELCGFREVLCDVIPYGESQGRTLVTESGRPVKAATSLVDASAFYDHVLETLRR
jgi:purine nucleosidase